MEICGGKEVHGRYINKIYQSHIHKLVSLDSLTCGNLFLKIEGFGCAIQDQVIFKISYRKYILKDNSVANTNCRICGAVNEIIEHMTNGCQKLAASDYINRHNNVSRIIQTELCLQYVLASKSLAYHKPISTTVLENDGGLVYWDREILTGSQHNRPDIFVYNKTTNYIYLIDISIPALANVEKKNSG